MTSPSPIRDRRIIALAALNTGLAGMLALYATRPVSAGPIPAQPPALSLPALSNGESGGPPPALPNIYEALLDQPVFHADRKYFPPPKAEAVDTAVPPPDLQLTGYMEIPGRPAKAFLKERQSGKALAVAVGDSVQGWTVVATSAAHVTLRQGERNAEVTRNARLQDITPAKQGIAAPASGSIAPSNPGAPPQGPGAIIAVPAPAAASPVPPPAQPQLPQAKPTPSTAADKPPPAEAPLAVVQRELAEVVVRGRRQDLTDEDHGPLVEVTPKGPLHMFSPPAATAAPQ